MGLLLFPLFAHVLSPRAYGIIDLAALASTLAGVTVALEVSQGLSRYFLDTTDPEERRTLASTAVIFTVCTFSAALAVALVFDQRLATILFGHGVSTAIMAAAIVGVWCSGLLYLTQFLLQIQFRPRAFGIVTVVTTVVGATTSAILVLGFRVGVIGAFIGQIAGAVAGTAVAFGLSRPLYSLRFNFRRLGRMLQLLRPADPGKRRRLSQRIRRSNRDPHTARSLRSRRLRRRLPAGTHRVLAPPRPPGRGQPARSRASRRGRNAGCACPPLSSLLCRSARSPVAAVALCDRGAAHPDPYVLLRRGESRTVRRCRLIPRRDVRVRSGAEHREEDVPHRSGGRSHRRSQPDPRVRPRRAVGDPRTTLAFLAACAVGFGALMVLSQRVYCVPYEWGRLLPRAIVVAGLIAIPSATLGETVSVEYVLVKVGLAAVGLGAIAGLVDRGEFVELGRLLRGLGSTLRRVPQRALRRRHVTPV